MDFFSRYTECKVQVGINVNLKGEKINLELVARFDHNYGQ